jgi:Fe2+ transport system protein FeoA
MGIKEVVKKLKAEKEADRRFPITIALKAKTIAKIEELAKQSNLSVSSIASEILDMGLAVGDSIEVLGEQMTGFAEKVIVANSTLNKAKKPVRRTTKKPVKFGGRR